MKYPGSLKGSVIEFPRRGFVSTPSVNTEAKAVDPIIMQGCLVLDRVNMDNPGTRRFEIGAVIGVSWSETVGEKVMCFAERWKLIAPGIWRVISLKE